MVEGPTRHQQYLLVSGMSIVFYSIVALISAFFFHKFYSISQARGADMTYLQTIGRFDDAKRNFFVVLMISSALELPYYVGCLVLDGPEDCEWESPSNLVFWYFHLIALCGYIICIVIPCVLWSDMINKKDGKLIFSNYQYDPIKKFFRFFLAAFFLNIFINILDTSIYYRLSDRSHYTSAPTYTVCALIESIISLLISIGCSYCGIKLQVYVRQAKLNPSAELKFLVTLNIIMGIVLLALLGRAIVIFGISTIAPQSFDQGMSYTVFTLISRWLPDVFCQLCLVYVMRHCGDEILKRNQMLAPIGVPNEKEGGEETVSPSRLLRMSEISVDLIDNEQAAKAPAMIIAKELSGHTIETLQAQSRIYRKDSQSSPGRPISAINSPATSSSLGSRRLILESGDVENPISMLVYGDERSISSTTNSKSDPQFSIDSSRSRFGDGFVEDMEL